MKNYSGLDAQQDIIQFLMDNDPMCMPENARTWLRDSAAQGDALTMIIRTMETLYSIREQCPEGRELARDLAAFVSKFNFWGLGGLTGRATQINSIMSRGLDTGVFVEEGDLANSPDMAPPESQAADPTIDPTLAPPVTADVETVI